MEHLFVSYKIALKAKQIGFKNSCLAFYFDNHLRYAHSCDYTEFSETPNVVLAPLYQQVIDWVYDEYKLVINLVHTTNNKWFCKLTIDYTKIHKGSGNFNYFDQEIQVDNDYSCYNGKYEALNNGIERALEYVEEKNGIHKDT